MPAPDDFPQPDLRDAPGRIRRLVISLVGAAVVGGSSYAIASTQIGPTQPSATYVAHNLSAGGFVIWVAAISAVVTFAIALVLQNYLARRVADRGHLPQAKTRAR
ncbi:MAG: hypothetical protein NT062_39420 [Proteobacteria bacterium]|nr:hypothetical protein [Pseudomonadota bacterium]